MEEGVGHWVGLEVWVGVRLNFGFRHFFEDLRGNFDARRTAYIDVWLLYRVSIGNVKVFCNLRTCVLTIH